MASPLDRDGADAVRADRRLEEEFDEVDSLEGGGFVGRRPHPDDGRMLLELLGRIQRPLLEVRYRA